MKNLTAKKEGHGKPGPWIVQRLASLTSYYSGLIGIVKGMRPQEARS